MEQMKPISANQAQEKKPTGSNLLFGPCIKDRKTCKTLKNDEREGVQRTTG